MRAEIGVDDLIALLKGLFVALQERPDPGLRERLLAVVLDGLRPPLSPK